MTYSGNQIRKLFLDYFASKQHQPVKSASLIPQNDPTLYFTNAGMVPFKNLFTGQETRDYSRATSSQKCMRVSGKHNDLENVGRTARHHTFFEMLGNFSFGDYFKKDAIAFAWEFLTQVLKMPTDRLWITVYQDDDEAAEIWQNDIGIPADRIVRMGEKDNFWSMGETGPCGPCSEIHYEQDIPCSLNNPHCAMGTCECDKYLEFWNLVFMQFERQQDGSMNPLPKPSIDTGLGLERLAALLQGKQSNYDCDLFTPLLQEIQKIVQKTYGTNDDDDISMRVIADHIRSCSFLINDGVLPSNEGRGYVLRRIMRRAIRHGKLLGQTHPFFSRLVNKLVQEMGEAYPDLKTNQSTIERVILSEEERFFETLDKGLKLLSEEIENLKSQKGSTLPGSVAFKLYDTYGFPLDLTELIANEHQLKIDQKGFDQCMTEQKERARAGWKGSGSEKVNQLYFDLSEKHQTQFLGYQTLEAPAQVLALIQDGQLVESVSKGSFEVLFDQTPFYGEGGGQAGDQGHLSGKDFKASVTDTQKPVPTLFIHTAKISEGQIKVGDQIQLSVHRKVRKATMRNHTATHIMHAALRQVLGSHVRQAGSLVNDKSLRFDFSHFESISEDLLQDIENQVNQVILDDLPVENKEMSYDEAIEKGALAFFGDKYGDQVRVVSIGDYSVELCGGTHLQRASEIGSFKIISEGSIAAGVRRIEAVTGAVAQQLAQKESRLLKEISASLKSNVEDLPAKIDKLKSQVKNKEKEIEKLKTQLIQGSADYLKDAFETNGVKAVVYSTDDAKSARDLAIAIRDKLQSGVAVVTAKTGPKAMIVVSVTKDLTSSYPANKILSPLAELVDGRGGGKPDMAQAGGTNPSGLSQVESKLKETLSSM